MLNELGYQITPANGHYAVQHPLGRTAVFLGDLVDRGPKTPEVLRLVMSMTESGAALTVPGNHDNKLMRKLNGRDVQVTHGLAESLQQLDAETPEFKERVASFIHSLVSHYVLDDGRLVVAHVGLKEGLQGRGSGRVRDFALYGETSGETDEFGLPVRYNWAAEYRGRAAVVYGHTPVSEPEWLNNTICVDTGCVFGGKLTALRYPERELVSVPAQQTYYAPRGPRGLVQPAIKCRGREYLRIIYGPEYTLPENLDRLRARGLSSKRSLALREFALGIEALERFARREPLRRVHECVFGVLALESEPVDPRL